MIYDPPDPLISDEEYERLENGANIIAVLREHRGLSQADLGRMVGVLTEVIDEIELDRWPLGLDAHVLLDRIASALNVRRSLLVDD